LMYSTCRTIAHSQEAIVWMPVHVSMLCVLRAILLIEVQHH
jgi:hypothetical protein